MKIELKIKNFKKIKDLETSFEGGNIYVIQGSNDIGKSTFLQAVKILTTGINKNDNNVSFGEQEGQIKGEFNLDGADNRKYVVKYDFTKEKNTFTLIDPLTKVHKSNSKTNVIANIFKYNAFTVDEWFGWGLTSEGRKKQADILLNLLPDSAKKEYLDIDTKINKRNGTLYKERTELNQLYEVGKANIGFITEEEAKLLQSKDICNKTIKELQEQVDNASNSKRIVIEQEVKSLDTLKDTYKNSIDQIEKQIKDLQESLTEKKASYLDFLEQIDNKKKELSSYPEITIDIPATKERISKGIEMINKISVIEANKARIDSTTKAVQELYDKSKAKDEEIVNLRKRSKLILEENKMPVKEISIIDGEAMYITPEGEVPFTKENVSYSAGGMVIAELMAHINKELPIWLIGSAESYDKSRLSKLQEIVTKYGGIIFLDQVIQDDNTPLTIKCIESE